MTDRIRRYRAGQKAETLAAWWLRARGYRILARRLKTPVGEIDLLARRGRVWAVVEVKYRQSRETAAEAISDRQWQRIARAFDWWRMQQALPEGPDRDIRFDALLVAPWRLPVHIRDAWRPGM